MRILFFLLFPLFSYSQLSIGILESSRIKFDGDSTAPKAFIIAANITDATQISAIYSLAFGLQQYGLWSKMKAIYPMVGGVASSHKYNLKDPRDLDAAFRLQFNGGWTHSSTGALPNGTNAYANTYLSPSAQQSLTSGHFSIYSRTSAASSNLSGSQGIYISASVCSYIIIRRNMDNARGGAMWSETSGAAFGTTTSPNGSGFYMLSRIASNDVKFYKNTTTLSANTTTQVSPTLSTATYFLSALNSGSGVVPVSFDNKELAFSTIGDGLTTTEETILYNLIQAYQTALGRQL